MDQISGGCTSQAHVWSNVNSSSSARLRLPPSGVISRADDVERALWTAGHCVVGFVEPQLDPPYGALWFRQDGPLSASSTWSVTDVNDMISPGCGVHIQSLRGVNQWGDCVGAAIANGDLNLARHLGMRGWLLPHSRSGSQSRWRCERDGSSPIAQPVGSVVHKRPRMRRGIDQCSRTARG